MAKKIAKGLWISSDLAEEFDREVERLGGLMPEKLEAGQVGAAALLTFIRLPDDTHKLEAIRAAKNYALEKALRQLAPAGIARAGQAGRLGDGAPATRADQARVRRTRRRSKTGG